MFAVHQNSPSSSRSAEGSTSYRWITSWFDALQKVDAVSIEAASCYWRVGMDSIGAASCFWRLRSIRPEQRAASGGASSINWSSQLLCANGADA